MTNAFPRAAEIERSLEMMAEQAGDPASIVYGRLFADHPEMRANFCRDTNDSVKGEMLARVFEAILDFIGERRYANHMIQAEIITHEGYDVDRSVFATFFGYVARAVKTVLGADWTPDIESAWAELLADMDHYVQTTPTV